MNITFRATGYVNNSASLWMLKAYVQFEGYGHKLKTLSLYQTFTFTIEGLYNEEFVEGFLGFVEYLGGGFERCVKRQDANSQWENLLCPWGYVGAQE